MRRKWRNLRAESSNDNFQTPKTSPPSTPPGSETPNDFYAPNEPLSPGRLGSESSNSNFQTQASSPSTPGEGTASPNEFHTPNEVPSPGRPGSESLNTWQSTEESPSRGEDSQLSDDWQFTKELRTTREGSETSTENWETPGEGSETSNENFETPKEGSSLPEIADEFHDLETCTDCNQFGPLNEKGKQREGQPSPDQTGPSNQGPRLKETIPDPEHQQDSWDSIDDSWEDPITTSEAMSKYNEVYAKLEDKSEINAEITSTDVAELSSAREDVVYSVLKDIADFGTITSAGATAMSQLSPVNNRLIYDPVMDRALWRSDINPPGQTGPQYQRYNPDMNQLAKGELAGYAVAGKLMDAESRAVQNVASRQIMDLASQPEVFARLGVFEGMPEADKSGPEQLDILTNMVKDGMTKTDWYLDTENTGQIMSHTLLSIIRGPEKYASLLSKEIIPMKETLTLQTRKIADTVAKSLHIANTAGEGTLNTVEGMSSKEIFAMAGGAVGVGAAALGAVLGGLFGGGIFASKKKRYNQKEGHVVDCHGPCKPISNHSFKQKMQKSTPEQPANTILKPIGSKRTSTTATILVTPIEASQVSATTHPAAPTTTSKPEVTPSHTTSKTKKHEKGHSSPTTAGEVPTPSATPQTNSHESSTSTPTQSPTTSKARLSQPTPSTTSTQSPTTSRATLSTTTSFTPSATSIHETNTFGSIQCLSTSTSTILYPTPSVSSLSFEQSAPATIAAPTSLPPAITLTMDIGIGISAADGENTEFSTTISSAAPLSTGLAASLNGVATNIRPVNFPSSNGTFIGNKSANVSFTSTSAFASVSSTQSTATPVVLPTEGIIPQLERPNKQLISPNNTNTTSSNETKPAASIRTPFAFPTAGRYFPTAGGSNGPNPTAAASALTWFNATAPSIEVTKITTLSAVILPSSAFVTGVPTITVSETQFPRLTLFSAPGDWGMNWNSTNWNGTVGAVRPSSAASARGAGSCGESSSIASDVPTSTGTFVIPPPPPTLSIEPTSSINVLSSIRTFSIHILSSTLVTEYVAKPSTTTTAAMPNPTSRSGRRKMSTVLR
ncbi:uncharacterized protein PAC_12770 [Phialocephala subalpina]|uniref:Uncharacterized protein n=1 Tax=Phialocephala subalpina TaxID=576137 RepID=A0A1L7XCY0_9HELO|nr:uncharacterized protein PAC_12770 [Phialocephala subalpina]